MACFTFPFDVSVAHLELGGGVGCAPGLVQNRVVEAGVPQLRALLIPVWAIAEDVCSSPRRLTERLPRLRPTTGSKFLWTKSDTFSRSGVETVHKQTPPESERSAPAGANTGHASESPSPAAHSHTGSTGHKMEIFQVNIGCSTERRTEGKYPEDSSQLIGHCLILQAQKLLLSLENSNFKSTTKSP